MPIAKFCKEFFLFRIKELFHRRDFEIQRIFLKKSVVLHLCVIPDSAILLAIRDTRAF